MIELQQNLRKIFGNGSSRQRHRIEPPIYETQEEVEFS